jgi:hypothetical protein
MPFTKRAWIAEAPGIGRISCPCGNAPLSKFGDGKTVLCDCGRMYDSLGWILDSHDVENPDKEKVRIQQLVVLGISQANDRV